MLADSAHKMRKDKKKKFEKANEIGQKKKASGMAIWGRRRRELDEMESPSATYSRWQGN